MTTKRLSAKQERAYAEWSADYEAGRVERTGTAIKGPAAAALGRAMLDAAIGPDATDTALGGRPALTSASAKGHRSPVRSLRLPEDLNSELDARAAAEHRRPSDVLREALRRYLATETERTGT